MKIAVVSDEIQNEPVFQAVIYAENFQFLSFRNDFQPDEVGSAHSMDDWVMLVGLCQEESNKEKNFKCLQSSFNVDKNWRLQDDNRLNVLTV